MQNFRAKFFIICQKTILYFKSYYKFAILFILIFANILLLIFFFKPSDFSNKEKYKLNDSFKNGLYIEAIDTWQDNKKHFLINSSEEIAECDSIIKQKIMGYNYTSDYFIVKKNNKFGVISTQGEIIFSPAYDSITLGSFLRPIFFVEKKILGKTFTGIAFNENEWLATLDTRNDIGKILKNNKIISDNIQLPEKAYILEKKEGITIVKDLQGNYITKAPFIRVRDNGFVVSDYSLNYNQDTGFIDLKGNLIIPLMFKDISPLSNAFIVEKYNKKLGVLSESGKLLLSPEFDSIKTASDVLDGHYIVSKHFLIVELNNKFGVYNLETESWLIPLKFDYIEYDSNGYFIIGYDGLYQKDDFGDLEYNFGKMMYFDIEKNDLLNDFTFEKAERFSNGLAAVRKNEKWGYIDTNGQLIIDFKYKFASSFSKANLSLVNDFNGSWYYINKDDNCVKKITK